MRTLSQINTELDRLRRVQEYLNFTIDSLCQKRNKIEDFAGEKQAVCAPNSPTSVQEYFNLESRVYDFMSEQSAYIDFVNGVQEPTAENTLIGRGNNI